MLSFITTYHIATIHLYDTISYVIYNAAFAFAFAFAFAGLLFGSILFLYNILFQFPPSLYPSSPFFCFSSRGKRGGGGTYNY
jgi:hypothetical protein